MGNRGIHEVFLVLGLSSLLFLGLMISSSHDPWFRDWTTYNPAGWNSGLKGFWMELV